MWSQEVQALAVFGIPLGAMFIGWRVIRAWEKRQEHEACMQKKIGAMLTRFKFEREANAQLRYERALYQLRDWEPSSEYKKGIRI